MLCLLLLLLLMIMLPRIDTQIRNASIHLQVCFVSSYTKKPFPLVIPPSIENMTDPKLHAKR